MATQVLKLDVFDNITPIFLTKDYSSCRILVCYDKQPIGWISIAHPNNQDGCISMGLLQKSIKEQIGWDVVHRVLGGRLSIDKTDIACTEPISVIVCTRNRTQQLEECIKALLHLQYPTYEIIIVDNAPSNEDTYKLTALLPVRYVREDRPGLDWARNCGIAEAQYKIVAFTDDDALVDRFWLQAIARAMHNSAVMAVTGYVAPATLDTPAQRIFELGYGGMGHGFRRRIIQRNTLNDKQLIWASSFGVGANMAFRRDIFSKIGYFDTALDVGTPSCGGGDIEMFHRLVAQGFMLIYEPAMLVQHAHRRYTPGLRKQIFDNGRGFGCYLITCLRSQSVKGTSIFKFFLLNWLFGWIIKNLIRPPRLLPRYMAAIELAGMLTSPMAYFASQKRVQKIKHLSRVELADNEKLIEGSKTV